MSESGKTRRGNGHILVVDASDGWAVKTCLSAAGYRVTLVSKLAEIEPALRQEEFDAMVLDPISHEEVCISDPETDYGNFAGLKVVGAIDAAIRPPLVVLTVVQNMTALVLKRYGLEESTPIMPKSYSFILFLTQLRAVMAPPEA